MPAFFVHGLIVYILYDMKGLIYGILPDLIGFGYYFFRLFMNYKFNKNDSLLKIISPKKCKHFGLKIVHDLSHSLILWLILLYLLKEKVIYAAIIAVVMDIFLHSSSNGGWRGPTFLYPISNYVFDGYSWNKPIGIIITIIITVLIYKYKDDIKNKLSNCCFIKLSLNN